MNIAGITSTTGLSASELRSPGAPLTAAERLQATKLRGEALRNATPAQQSAAVASQFEAIMVRQLLGKTLTSMLGTGGGAAASVYGDLITDTFAQQLTAGSGMGLGRVIEQQLTPRSSTAATSNSSQA